MIYNESQKELADKIDSGLSRSGWKDWKWQLRHAIRSLDKFEHLTGIRFEGDERSALERTFGKFPLSITPYYLSLIDRENYRNDPVFKQAFGSVQELNTHVSELEDPGNAQLYHLLVHHKVVLRNYEGVITTYKEPDSYEPKMCDRDCESCNLELNLTRSDESEAIGIEKLLSDSDDTISLDPEKNERILRREDHGGQD